MKESPFEFHVTFFKLYIKSVIKLVIRMYENSNENISVVDRWHCSTLRNNKLKSFSSVVEIKKNWFS